MDGGNVELELAQYRGQLSLYLPEKKNNVRYIHAKVSLMLSSFEMMSLFYFYTFVRMYI